MTRTPLYEEHVAAGGKVVDFHGWALPVQFEGIVQEHLHTRSKASLFDCSHMAEFSIRGEQAIAAYDCMVCSNVGRIKAGRARYGAMLDNQGGLIDDIITMRVAGDELYVVTNAGPRETVSARIREHVPGAEDLSDATSKIDVQGPLSRDVLGALGIKAALDLPYFGLTRTAWEGHDILVSRTGYTGELGYELYVPNDAAPALWRALLAHGGVHPAGLGARDTLRTEMGYPLSGQDFDSSKTPLHAAMDPFIAWKSDFVGKEALTALRERGDYPVLTPICTKSRRAPRRGFEVYDGDTAVGLVTSGTFGPSVGHGIGLAYLPKSLNVPGTALTAGPKRIDICTAELPFYKEGTCRD